MGREITCKDRPLVMGILNVTPDSFFDGGKYGNAEKAVRHALELIEDGADLIDVGGESTRPFSAPTKEEEELDRVIPVIKAIRKRSEIPISIDTYKSGVARAACEAGADMINDISGLRFDPLMAATAAKLCSYVVIMHMKGTPGDMQNNPYYDGVIGEIRDFFRGRIDFALSQGIKRDRIILDPGIGFGKRVEDNLRIIGQLGRFKGLGIPILIGTSMKSFIGQVTDSPLEERGEGTLASVALSIWNGAHIVRVHDVKRARKTVSFVKAVMNS